jgi:hypothetical protein
MCFFLSSSFIFPNQEQIFVDIFIFRGQELGAREQPVGANSVFQHSELMVMK